ncbi:MAG: HEPN domain-containing protein [Armatimonadota bacterium]
MDRAVAYWVTLSESDLASARALLGAGQYLTAAYHCQQALEKMLKALIQQRQDDPPPRRHNLEELAKLVSAWRSMSQTQRDNLLHVDGYGIEGRYPTVVEAPLTVIDESGSQEVLDQTEELMAWLRERLAAGPADDEAPLTPPGHPPSEATQPADPSPDVIDRVEGYLARLRTRVRVDAAWVFGSQVTGTSDAQSDIDLAVISRDFGSDRDKDWRAVMRSRQDGDGPMDVLRFSWDEYVELPRGSFLREVMKHGRLIAGAPRPSSSEAAGMEN